MTEEQKAAMAAGRERAREARLAGAKEAARENLAEQGAIVESEEMLIARLDATLADEPQDEGQKVDRRARLLEGIDPEIAKLISDDELDDIEREEKSKAAAERKKRALASVRDQMRQRARVENDLIESSVLRSDAEKKRLAEKVRFRVTLPSDGAGHRGQNGFRVDGRLFQHGHTYTETRAVFESLFSAHYRAWLNEIQFRTLDQHKPGNSAAEVVGHHMPQFEVLA